jgi:hypothetical protein
MTDIPTELPSTVKIVNTDGTAEQILLQKFNALIRVIKEMRQELDDLP